MILAIIRTQDTIDGVTTISLGEIKEFESKAELMSAQDEAELMGDGDTYQLLKLNERNTSKLRDEEATDAEGRGIDDIIEEREFHNKLEDTISNDFSEYSY